MKASELNVKLNKNKGVLYCSSLVCQLCHILTKGIFTRSNHLEVFCKTSVLKNFGKFTGKHLCKSLFFNKVADLKSANLLKKTPT